MIDRLLNRRLRFVSIMDLCQNLFLIPLLITIGFWVSYQNHLTANFDLNYQDYYDLNTMQEIHWYQQQIVNLIIMFTILLFLFISAYVFNLIVITTFLQKYIAKIKKEFNWKVKVCLYLSYIPIVNLFVFPILLVYYTNLNDWNKALNIQTHEYISAY
ncbi:hypothetical protein [Ureaplasma zalophigenitalium]|uniref:DUF4328 domain-containing protein n=1 Tax=Ureaplasma zalophigenitalium TaxID=907723 RepID=A0ABT3BPH0_9BACT|nr:hypothetical protein [Ureaplasma zalophigenitalium]MCV3754126.1 hypothetical protein [Ureaplasma zalophigenitalium]